MALPQLKSQQPSQLGCGVSHNTSSFASLKTAMSLTGDFGCHAGQ